MAEWEPKALWEQIMETLRERIQRGVYPPRTRIPAIPRLMQEFEIGRNTALHAVQSLEEQGLVKARHGVGTFVVPPEDRA